MSFPSRSMIGRQHDDDSFLSMDDVREVSASATHIPSTERH